MTTQHEGQTTRSFEDAYRIQSAAIEKLERENADLDALPEKQMVTTDQLRNSARFGVPLRAETIIELANLIDELRAAAAKLPDGDARDAARFRFIYETENWNPCRYDKTVGWHPVNHFTIDAAMQHSPAKEGK